VKCSCAVLLQCSRTNYLACGVEIAFACPTQDAERPSRARFFSADTVHCVHLAATCALACVIAVGFQSHDNRDL
jgi:hypothetical protein